jgi:hypothetical protein
MVVKMIIKTGIRTALTKRMLSDVVRQIRLTAIANTGAKMIPMALISGPIDFLCF